MPGSSVAFADVQLVAAPTSFPNVRGRSANDHGYGHGPRRPTTLLDHRLDALYVRIPAVRPGAG
jgi:hypothetical protein